MLAPALILFTLFLAAPIVYTIVLSLQKRKIKGLGLGPGAQTIVFAGFDNYAKSLKDPEFLASAGRILIYALVFIPTMLLLALVFALLLDSRRSRGRGFFRVTLFLPFAVPSVVSSLLWGFLYIPALSPFFYVFGKLGLHQLPSPLDPRFVTLAIANIGVWGGVGFNMIIMYTALKAISTELFEAAKLDGASEIQVALRIKIPIIAPAIGVTTLFTVIGTIQLYAEPTTLAPLGTGISSTWSPLMLVYRDAFVKGDIYGAAATSVLIALATFVISVVALTLVQRRASGQKG